MGERKAGKVRMRTAYEHPPLQALVDRQVQVCIWKRPQRLSFLFNLGGGRGGVRCTNGRLDRVQGEPPWLGRRVSVRISVNPRPKHRNAAHALAPPLSIIDGTPRLLTNLPCVCKQVPSVLLGGRHLSPWLAGGLVIGGRAGRPSLGLDLPPAHDLGHLWLALLRRALLLALPLSRRALLLLLLLCRGLCLRRALLLLLRGWFPTRLAGRSLCDRCRRRVGTAGSMRVMCSGGQWGGRARGKRGKQHKRR